MNEQINERMNRQMKKPLDGCILTALAYEMLARTAVKYTFTGCHALSAYIFLEGSFHKFFIK